MAESEPDSSTTWAISVSSGQPMRVSRARIQLTFPWIVLISPLWQRSLNGWARSHDGVVLVENRWWKIPKGAVTAGSRRSA